MEDKIIKRSDTAQGQKFCHGSSNVLSHGSVASLLAKDFEVNIMIKTLTYLLAQLRRQVSA
jgi:hypothetical protein